jgi:hypothetical protein
MKRLSFALFLLLSFSFLIGQNEFSKDQLIQIKSNLEAKKKIIEDSIAIIDKEIKKKEAQEFELKYSSVFKLPSKMNRFDILRKEANWESDILMNLHSGDSVDVLDYVPKTKYFKVKHNELVGFVDVEGVVKTDDIHNLMTKKDQNYEVVKAQEAKQSALEKEQQAKQRKQNLINKYGTDTADKILAHKIWLGMTKDMAIESWGKPKDINRTVTSYSVSEQWVYGDRYLYFDDGILTSWQDGLFKSKIYMVKG